MIEPAPISLVLAIGIFLLARRHYVSGLLVGVVLIPTFLLRHSLGPLPTNTWEMIVTSLLLAGAIDKEQRSVWRAAGKRLPAWPTFCIIALLIAALLSTIISDQAIVSLGILKGWFIVPLLFAALIYAELKRTPALGKQVIAALIASGLSVALLAMVMDRTPGRLVGIYDVPNSLALYLAPLAAATLWQSVHRPKYIISAATLYAAIIGTQSLAGLLAPLVAIMTMWLVIKYGGVSVSPSPDKGRQGGVQSTTQPPPPPLSGGNKKRAILILCALILLAAPAIGEKITYLRSTSPTSLDVRLQLWSIGWELAQEHPLRGLGLGQFEPAYQQKLHQRFSAHQKNNDAAASPSYQLLVTSPAAASPLPEFVFRDPHTWPLAFHLNTGLLGLTAFVTLNIWLCVHSWRGKKTQQVAAAMLLCMLLQGLVDTIYFKNDLSALYWIIAALMSQSRHSMSPVRLGE